MNVHPDFQLGVEMSYHYFLFCLPHLPFKLNKIIYVLLWVSGCFYVLFLPLFLRPIAHWIIIYSTSYSLSVIGVSVFFFLSHKCLYSEIFLVDAEIYCCVHGIVTGFSVPFYFSLSSLIFFVVVCQFKTKHSGIIVFMKLQNLVSIHTYRTGLDIINVALTLWCSLDLKMVKVLKRKIE